jgi:hypothetical protein
VGFVLIYRPHPVLEETRTFFAVFSLCPAPTVTLREEDKGGGLDPNKKDDSKDSVAYSVYGHLYYIMSSDLAVHEEAPYKILTDEVVGRHMVAARHIQVINVILHIKDY